MSVAIREVEPMLRTGNWTRHDAWRSSVPRGIALFFGVFSLVNLAGDFRSPGFDASLWWIDLRLLPAMLAKTLLVLLSFVLITFALFPMKSRRQRLLTGGCAAMTALLALLNAGQFYGELLKDNITSSFPLPLSLFVSAAFIWIAAAALQSRYGERKMLPLLASFVFCMLAFPVLQVLCFGKTDYRRPADVAVVLGARAYADGRPSDALADRVRTACELYNQGLVKKLIFSGGPGDGAIHETESMRRYAVSLGVKDQDIFVDEAGLNTQATVKNTRPMFDQLKARRILVVSHFYHLPRIKMAYQRDGCEVYTVPAREAYFLRQTPYMVLRETAALWVYYARPLRT